MDCHCLMFCYKQFSQRQSALTHSGPFELFTAIYLGLPVHYFTTSEWIQISTDFTTLPPHVKKGCHPTRHLASIRKRYHDGIRTNKNSACSDCCYVAPCKSGKSKIMSSYHKLYKRVHKWRKNRSTQDCPSTVTQGHLWNRAELP